MSSKNAHKCIISVKKNTTSCIIILKLFQLLCLCGVEKKERNSMEKKSSAERTFFIIYTVCDCSIVCWADLNYNGNNNTVNGWNGMCVSLFRSACTMLRVSCHYKQQCYTFKIQIKPRLENGWKLRSRQVQKMSNA